MIWGVLSVIVVIRKYLQVGNRVVLVTFFLQDGVRLIAGGAQFGDKQNQKITKGQKVKRKTCRESLEKKFPLLPRVTGGTVKPFSSNRYGQQGERETRKSESRVKKPRGIGATWNRTWIRSPGPWFLWLCLWFFRCGRFLGVDRGSSLGLTC